MKKVPMRKCVVTGEILEKNQLIRVVRNKEGQVFVDATGKMNGRGAYLKRSLEAIEIANQSNFGLCGCIISKDQKVCQKVANELECGGVIINGASFFRSFKKSTGVTPNEYIRSIGGTAKDE